MRQSLLILAAVGWLVAARADVKPNALFSDGAVLQQGIEVPVWGSANDGEKVVVKFQGQEISTTAKDGRWLVRLKPLKPGGPFALTIRGENEISLKNILVGEVWLCSGQSNMAFQLHRAENGAEAIADAADAQLRFFFVPHESADAPQKEVVGSWKESSSQTASNFSAVAYFFGRDLRRARNVPVGLIEASVGGTPAEAWTSREALAADPELKKILELYAANLSNYDSAMAEHTAAQKAAAASGKPTPARPKKAADPRVTAKRPAGLYNAMIAPLQPYALAGAIWYQGEANSGRAEQYQKLFPAMIRNWREAWGQGEFPFLFVQIAPHERMTPEIREAQSLTARNVPRTAMAVIVDVGNKSDIHPKKKEPVGARLALAARAIAYGEKVESSGPIFSKMTTEKSRAILSFTHAGGLVAKGGTLAGFTIAGPDGKFVSATARIEGERVVVQADAVKEPAAVRYGWENAPVVNLFNGAGLPASPFRTDVK